MGKQNHLDQREIDAVHGCLSAQEQETFQRSIEGAGYKVESGRKIVDRSVLDALPRSTRPRVRGALDGMPYEFKG